MIAVFTAAGGLLLGGAMSVLRQPPRTRGVWVAALVLCTASALCLANAVARL